MSATFDHSGFVNALDRARQERGLSWRQLAGETNLEPSTLQRIVAGSIPDLPRFAALIDWLTVSADMFIQRERGHMDLRLGNGQLIRCRTRPQAPLSDAQLQHVEAAMEEIIKAIEATRVHP